MSDVHIAGTGIWFPEDIITNDKLFLHLIVMLITSIIIIKMILRKEIFKQWNIHHLRSLKKHQYQNSA